MNKSELKVRDVCEMPSKRYHMDHDYNLPIINCPSCDKDEGFNQAIDEIGNLPVGVGSDKPCEHDWVWSNNAGMHFCSKCNEKSYLGNHKNFQVATDSGIKPSPSLVPLKRDDVLKHIQDYRDSCEGDGSDTGIAIAICSKFGLPASDKGEKK